VGLKDELLLPLPSFSGPVGDSPALSAPEEIGSAPAIILAIMVLVFFSECLARVAGVYLCC